MEENKGGLAERVLILAPEGRNASVAAAMLSRQGFDCTICDDGFSLAAAMKEGAGVVLLTDYTLYNDELGPIKDVWLEQPSWSELPLVLLAWPETGEEALKTVADFEANARLVDRPASALTLVTAVESALRARRRQYRIRDLLAELRHLNEDLEARVARRTHRVRELATALAQAEELERERIAQLLHDHLQQILVAVSFQLQLLASEQKLDSAMRTALAEIEETVAEAVAVTQSLSVELSPPVLRREGLAAALRWLKGEMESNHRLEVTLSVDEGASAAGEELGGLLFRSARELLFNVVKHAETRQAQITLDRNQERLFLTVADNGRGFAPEAAEKAGSGYGLPSIRERIALYQGSVEIESSPGAGTAVTIALPL